MRACSVCLHPDKSAIDAALTEGGKLRAVAETHGLSKSAVGRHRNNCLAPRIAAAARIVAPVKDTVRETQRIQAIAKGQLTPSHPDVLSLSGLVDRLGRSLTASMVRRIRRWRANLMPPWRLLALSFIAGSKWWRGCRGWGVRSRLT